MVVNSVVVTLGPRVDITLTTGAVLQILKENFCYCDRSHSVEGELAVGPQKLVLILLNKRSVEHASFEGVILENPLKELNVGGETNHFVVLKSLLESVDGVLSSISVHDDFRDHRIVEGGDCVTFPDTRVNADLAFDLLRLT